MPWPIGLIAPQMNIGYSAVEPLSQYPAVYSVAYAIDGQPELIPPTIKNGIQTSVNNLVQGELSWIASYFPPLPPIGGAAAVVAPKPPHRAAASAPEAGVSEGHCRRSVRGARQVTRVKAAASTTVGATATGKGIHPRRRRLPCRHRLPGVQGHFRSASKGTPGAASSVKAGRAGR